MIKNVNGLMDASVETISAVGWRHSSGSHSSRDRALVVNETLPLDNGTIPNRYGMEEVSYGHAPPFGGTFRDVSGCFGGNCHEINEDTHW